jgi:nitrogen fixation NifU-like protein
VKVEQMYQEVILDHYRNPLHHGLREPYDVEVHHVNPTCGDELRLRVRVDGRPDQAVVADVSYEAQGCSISQASTSVMADLVIGRTPQDALALLEAFRELMHGRGTVSPDEELLQDAAAFAGVARYPARVKCALLGWMALQDALAKALGEQPSSSTKDEA